MLSACDHIAAAGRWDVSPRGLHTATHLVKTETTARLTTEDFVSWRKPTYQNFGFQPRTQKISIRTVLQRPHSFFRRMQLKGNVSIAAG